MFSLLTQSAHQPDQDNMASQDPSARSKAGFGRHRESLAVGLVLGIAAILRFYHLSYSSLWHDEGNTWALVQRGFAQIARDSAADIHPPGYYWLLKLWTVLAGTNVAGLRSFSAVMGVVLVWVIYRIARRLFHDRFGALLAAFLAAINPFLVYYSQEARMYALLALESGILIWALLVLLDKETTEEITRETPNKTISDGRKHGEKAGLPAAAITFATVAALGLWTHYSFPIVLAAAGLAYLWRWLSSFFASQREEQHRAGRQRRNLLRFIGLNLVALLVFSPWLPIAIERVLNWPNPGHSMGAWDGLGLTLQTLTVGPIRTGPELAWPWLVVIGILPLFGLWRLRHSPGAPVIGLWLLGPVGMMFGLRLFTDAFLKFLLIAAPAWSLLTGAAVAGQPPRTGESGTVRGLLLRSMAAAGLVIGGITLASVALSGYYQDPAARDNYAGIARYVQVMGDPAADLVVLDAPGQQEVWAYYDAGVPVLPLPAERPPDANATLAALQQATANRRQVFALFWATDQSDPDGIVENWLNQHAFKGLESWQGNVRFVAYRLPNQLTCRSVEPPVAFPDLADLTELCRPASVPDVAAGDIALVSLKWRPLARTDRRYKVTVQLLDARDQVIAQQDSEPAGGSRPTNTWQPGDTILDNHGVMIPPGTPPGSYRLIVAVYDGESGQRLSTSTGADAISVGEVTVTPPRQTFPLDIIPIQHRLQAEMGPVTLVGYDAFRKGFAHSPDTPVQPGDLVHVTLYWQAPEELPDNWPEDLEFSLQLGDQSITGPLAGGVYPTGQWRGGDFVRGEFDIPYDGTDNTLWLVVGQRRVRLGKIRAQ